MFCAARPQSDKCDQVCTSSVSLSVASAFLNILQLPTTELKDFVGLLRLDLDELVECPMPQDLIYDMHRKTPFRMLLSPPATIPYGTDPRTLFWSPPSQAYATPIFIEKYHGITSCTQLTCLPISTPRSLRISFMCRISSRTNRTDIDLPLTYEAAQVRPNLAIAAVVCNLPIAAAGYDTRRWIRGIHDAGEHHA